MYYASPDSCQPNKCVYFWSINPMKKAQKMAINVCNIWTQLFMWSEFCVCIDWYKWMRDIYIQCKERSKIDWYYKQSGLISNDAKSH